MFIKHELIMPSWHSSADDR